MEIFAGVAMNFLRRIRKSRIRIAIRHVKATPMKCVGGGLSVSRDDQKANFGVTGGGGTDYWNIWLTGAETSVPSFGGGSSSSDTSSTSPPTTTSPPTRTGRTGRTTARPSVVTSVAPGRTIVITQSASQSSGASSPSAQANSGSSNVAGIAAGVVVGVVAVASIATGVFFWLRHRRRRDAEEEYKRTQVGDFIHGGKPPQTGYSSISDSRLDPEAGNKRNSQGSIADAGDYSRRILRVSSSLPL